MSFFTLKLVALLSMLWDHLAYVWPLALTVEVLFFPEVSETIPALLVLQRAADYIGRIAAPVFLFSIANGYRHTRNFKKYALRLLIFACLAEYPYYLLFGFHGNIMFTLLLGLLTLRLVDWGNGKRDKLGYVLAAGVIAAAQYFSLTEGNGSYILFILVFYWTENWSIPKKALLWLFLMPLSRYKLIWMFFSEQLFTYRWFHMLCLNALGPLLGVAFTFCYNGKKGAAFPGDKYLWYIFYPTHLLLLGLAQQTLLAA
ncbi:MAG: conjugal transfer protein TraX [Lawsonibacter sp.]|nr:conjugal transfer protein TraX [Lawsonibacter sp.]